MCADLYGLPPAEFTAARNEAARRARADRERDLATRIKGLGKPTTSAWLVNRLAREPDEELAAVVELGRDLREAMAASSGDQLRALTRRRHELIAALVARAREIGAAHGTRVSDTVAAEVRQTLEAALAEPSVAETVLAGCTTHPAEYAGFGSPGPLGPAEPRAWPRGEVADLAARRRADAERTLAEAAHEVREAAGRHDEARQRFAQAQRGVADAERELEQRRHRLEESERDTFDAARALERARAAEAEAEEFLRSLSQT